MAELVTQFATACSNIEPEDDDVSNASAAHLEVRDVLEHHPTLAEWSISTILIGSYARQVSIRRVKDVDVFSMLPDLGTELSSVDLLDLFAEALSDYGDRLERQDRSIKIDFPEFGLHVDAVPARPSGEFWEIPDRVPPGAAEAWQRTNPMGLGTASTEMNKRFGGNYVPVVKLIRQTRRTAMGDARPGGHFFEVLTYHAFNGMRDEMRDASRPRLYVEALQLIAAQLTAFRDGAGILDPSMSGELIRIRVTEEEKEAAATKFAEVATRAHAALEDAGDSVCPAATEYQRLLGVTESGSWAFPLPAYCEPDGTEKAGLTPGGRVPAGNGRFG